MDKPNVLFICSRNKWRSPTAERIYRGNPHIFVRSGGTSTKGYHQVNENDIRWADLIIFMENRHKSKLTAQFRGRVPFPPAEVLGIPDKYEYMDEELIEILKPQVDYLLQKHFSIAPAANYTP